MATIRIFLAATLMVCASPLVHAQAARQEAQTADQLAPRPAGSSEAGDASVNADVVSSVKGPSLLTSTSTHAAPAIAQVQGSFKVYPEVAGAQPLPLTGKWSVPSTPLLAFLPACKASKASCLEVDYSVPALNVVCLWTVLFPAPTVVNGKKIQTPTVINEDSNAAEYFMMVRLQSGMNYASVTTQAPVYPTGAKAKDWTGSVSVDIIVSPSGKVVSIPGVRGPTGLQASAKLAVGKWVYAPTKIGSQAVARSFTVQVNYGVGVAVK